MKYTNNGTYWHNYVTGEYDYLDMPQTDEEALNYLPQYPAARMLYELQRSMGDSILNAMGEVLSACVGETWDHVA
jgi:hypothetical protein